MSRSRIASLASVVLGLAACKSGGGERRVSPEVVLQAAAGDLRVEVEVARADPDRQRGLMWRQRLEPGHGMLFLFEQPQQLKFWMKNTYIPLDMIFIGADYKIVQIEENAEPLTLSARGPDAFTQYVLEVPGGWTRAHGVAAGMAVRFVGID